LVLTARPLRYQFRIATPANNDAILLMLHLKADLVLMDEREGVEETRRLGLTATRDDEFTTGRLFVTALLSGTKNPGVVGVLVVLAAAGQFRDWPVTAPPTVWP
jgi:hypothetical protein